MKTSAEASSNSGGSERIALSALLARAVLRHGDQNFLVHRSGTMTYGEFQRRVATVASALSRVGIRKGDRVALMLSNRPEFLVAWFAAASVGAIEVPINPRFQPREMHTILEHAGVSLMFLENGNVGRVESLSTELPELRELVVVDGGFDPAVTPKRSKKKWRNWQGFCDQASTVVKPDSVSSEDPAVIIYTSGTTGKPKGVVLSHRSAILTGEATAFMLGATASDRLMTPNPLVHVNAQFHGALSAMAVGAGFVLLGRFRRSHILEQARKHDASILLLAAAATRMMFSRPEREDDGETKLRTLLTGGVPEDIYRIFERRFALSIQTAFAMTEAPLALMAPIVSVEREPTPGVGMPVRHPDMAFANDVEIVDEQGVRVAPWVRGEIRIRNAAVMTGYWKDSVATCARKRDGWLWTGDLGYKNPRGYFFFVGRMGDVIRRRGELVSPAEIEAVLHAHPSVEESAVVGVTSELGVGEQEIVAYVVLDDDRGELTTAELVQWCAPRLSRFKIPSSFVFRDSLPKTSLGKIQKARLTESEAPR